MDTILSTKTSTSCIIIQNPSADFLTVLRMQVHNDMKDQIFEKRKKIQKDMSDNRRVMHNLSSCEHKA